MNNHITKTTILTIGAYTFVLAINLLIFTILIETGIFQYIVTGIQQCNQDPFCL